MGKTLIIGPSPSTRGGITSVIKAHQSSFIWKKWNCIWISSYIDKRVFFKILFFVFALVRFLFNLSRAKIVHIHFSEPNSAMRKSIFLSIAYFFKKRIILHFHAFSPETTIYGKHKSLYKRMFKKSDVIIGLSKIWEEHIKTLTDDPNKIMVVYNPCPTVLMQHGFQKEKNILFAGTLNMRKGYLDLIEAFSLIAKKYPDWKVIFAGNGEIEEGEKRCKSLNVIDQVYFTGWISGKDKEQIFQTASIFCLPSYAEGFPMAVLDAWSYGLPVITTPVGGLPDVLKHGENAMVFEPGDIESLSKNLEELINNHKLREKLSRESLIFSKNQFNIDNIAKQLDSIYSDLLSTTKN